MLNIRIRNYLHDIIDVAYKDEPKENRDRYKKFYLSIETKELGTTSGMYYGDKHLIKVYSPRLDHMVKTCLHELAHHIDLCRNGTTGHQKPFYDEYQKLVYASLDMGLCQPEEFYLDSSSADRNKVRKMVDNYIPHPVRYEAEEIYTIRVYNAYEQKRDLLSLGFSWNRVEECWEKVSRDPDSDAYMLEDIGIYAADETTEESETCYIVEESSLRIEAIVYVVVRGDISNKVRLLKEYGFYYSRKHECFICKVKSKDLKPYFRELRLEEKFSDLQFAVLKR